MLSQNKSTDDQKSAPATVESKRDKSDDQNNVLMKKSIKSEENIPLPPTLLAWCSMSDNNISIIDLESKQSYANFEGVQLTLGDTTHVKEISNTKLLVSLNHYYANFASMEIFDVSKRDHPEKIYSFEEVSGVTGYGDVTYNSRRGLLGAISVQDKITYHLFSLGYSGKTGTYSVKLLRKSKWQKQGGYDDNEEDNPITGLDFNPTGEFAATIDKFGTCLVSDMNTARTTCRMNFNSINDFARCKWSTNIGEPLLFIKYGHCRLLVSDVEKKTLLFNQPFRLDNIAMTYSIDICQNNGNLLAAGGDDSEIKIFDKRESKIVKTFGGIHDQRISCVRWNPLGDMLATTSDDQTIKMLDFGTGKVLYTGSSHSMPAMSVCFI